MSKHTAGPWRSSRRNWKGIADDNKLFICGNVHWDGNYQVSTGVCIVEGNATSQEVTKANAALIIAAPDLLEICQAIVADGRDEMLHAVQRKQLYAAIAKAEGEANP